MTRCSFIPGELRMISRNCVDTRHRMRTVSGSAYIRIWRMTDRGWFQLAAATFCCRRVRVATVPSTGGSGGDLRFMFDWVLGCLLVLLLIAQSQYPMGTTGRSVVVVCFYLFLFVACCFIFIFTCPCEGSSPLPPRPLNAGISWHVSKLGNENAKLKTRKKAQGNKQINKLITTKATPWMQ